MEVSLIIRYRLIKYISNERQCIKIEKENIDFEREFNKSMNKYQNPEMMKRIWYFWKNYKGEQCI